MKEGTIFFVLKFPQPWPPQHEGEVFSKKQEGSKITVRATPEGCLLFSVTEDDQVVVAYKSQPIRFGGGGHVLLNAVWSAGHLDMRINNLPVAAFDTVGNSELLIETKEHVIQDPPSLTHPDAAKYCKEWMEWRKSRYANPKSYAKKNRRLKTLEEQVAELQNAIASLVDLVALIQSEKSHFLGHLATELRALIYWNGKNYSPLLLRVAGRFGLPLPVYMLPEKRRNPPAIIKEAQQWVRTNEPSIIKTIPNQEIVDLQEWLSTPFQTALFSRDSEGTPSVQEDTTTAKELILGVAAVLGSAHYDEDLPDHLEMLYGVTVFGISAVGRFLLNSSAIIIELGKYVLVYAGNTMK